MEQARKREELGRSVGCSQQEQKKTFWTKPGVWPTSYKHSLAWQNIYKTFPDCTRRTLVSYTWIRLKCAQIYITSSVQDAQAKWAACFSTSNNTFKYYSASRSPCLLCTAIEPALQNPKPQTLGNSVCNTERLLKAKKQCNSHSFVWPKMVKQESVQNIH